MKVLHIIDSGGLYGAEVMLLTLVEEQLKLGLQPTIASIGVKNIPEKPLETEALKRGLSLVKFRMVPGPNILGACSLLRFAKKEGFDLLHSHGYKGNILFGLMPKRFRKIPIVSTLHGYTSTNGLSLIKIYEWLDSFSHKFIDAVVLVNKGMLTNPKLNNRKSINYHIINNGITKNEFPDNNLTTHRFDRNFSQFNNSTNQQIDYVFPQLDKEIVDFCSCGFTIGSIGRLSTEKGYEYLIEAIKLLKDNGIEVRLIIIGEGDRREYLEKLIIRNGLVECVMLPGYREDAKYYLRLFDLFVISSLTEGLPISILEAMQAKVPIVASAVGGIPEVLDEGIAGILVEPGKYKDLSESISQIYNNNFFSNKLTDNAYNRVANLYNSKNMAKKYLNIYSESI